LAPLGWVILSDWEEENAVLCALGASDRTTGCRHGGRRLAALFLIAAVALATVSCEDDELVSTNIEGSWTGTWTSGSAAGDFTVSFTPVPNYTDLYDFELTLLDTVCGPTPGITGEPLSIGAIVTGSSVRFTVRFAPGLVTGDYHFDGSAKAGAMNGTFVSAAVTPLPCLVGTSGSWSVARSP
jgi:hypothetical protein